MWTLTVKKYQPANKKLLSRISLETARDQESAPTWVDDAVMLWQKDGTEEVFVKICSPADMKTRPLESAMTADDVFFRKNTADMIFRSDGVMNELCEVLVNDVKRLAGAVRKLTAIENEGDFTI